MFTNNNFNAREKKKELFFFFFPNCLGEIFFSSFTFCKSLLGGELIFYLVSKSNHDKMCFTWGVFVQCVDFFFFFNFAGERNSALLPLLHQILTIDEINSFFYFLFVWKKYHTKQERSRRHIKLEQLSSLSCNTILEGRKKEGKD